MKDHKNKGRGPEGHTKEIAAWADPAMYSAQPVAHAGPRVSLVTATPDPLGAMAAMCAIYEGRAIQSRNEVTDEMRHYYWDEQMKTHLKAPLESIDFHFLIEGVTRAFTHQMVRQRTAVYAQESMRFAVKENMAEEIDLPPTIRKGSLEAGVWVAAVEDLETAYKFLLANGVPGEDARGLLPTATRTRLHYKTNLRNFTTEVGKRLCTQAQFEWRWVVSQMVQAIRGYTNGFIQGLHGSASETDKWQFEKIADSNLFRPVCYQVGHCVFESDMDRACTIRERVQEGKFDEINDAEWLVDVNSARPDRG